MPVTKLFERDGLRVIDYRCDAGPQNRPFTEIFDTVSYVRPGTFGCATRGRTAELVTSVDAFHRKGLEACGRDNGRPGLRSDYSPTYYAAFLLDPDGNNVEAVCLD